MIDGAGRRTFSVIESVAVNATRACLASMVAVTLLDVVGRNLGRPLPGASELVSLLLGGTFFGGAALAARDGSHIRIGMVVDHQFRGRLLRAEATMSRWASTGCFAALAWMTFREARALQVRDVRTEFLNLPQWLVIYGLALLAIAAAAFSCVTGRSDGAAGNGGHFEELS